MQLVEGHVGGDPMTERKWVRRSLRHLSGDLSKLGHAACPNTTARLLRKRKFSLKSNRKGQTGPPHPDRNNRSKKVDWQFRTADPRIKLHRLYPVIQME